MGGIETAIALNDCLAEPFVRFGSLKRTLNVVRPAGKCEILSAGAPDMCCMYHDARVAAFEELRQDIQHALQG